MEKKPANTFQELDPGIAAFVRALQEDGVETYESCQGGKGHCFFEPTIRFSGSQYEGYRAFAVAKMKGLPVSNLRRFWSVQDGELVGPQWEMTFSRPHSRSTDQRR